MSIRALALHTPRALASIGALLVAAACGARSTLGDAAGTTTGAGGAGAQGGGGPGTTGQSTTGQSTTGQTTTGQGGAGAAGGGPPVLCAQLVEVGPIAQPVPKQGFAFRDPMLLPLAPGGALLLARSAQLESPGPVPSAVDTVPFSPWGAWPPAFPAPKFAYPVSDPVPFAASIEPAGTLSLGVTPYPMNAPPGCAVDAVYGILPAMPQWPNVFIYPVQGGCEDTPLAVGSNAEGVHFAAIDLWAQGAGFGQRALTFQLFDEGGKLLIPPAPVCASTPHTGDLIAGNHDFLFVHSAAPNGACGGGAGPATTLVLRRLAGNSASAAIVYQGTDDLVLTRLLPRSEGAWLIFRESGASAVLQPPAMAMRILPDDTPTLPFAITDQSAGQVAVAPFGDGFAVAAVDSIDPSAPTILLRVYSAQGLLTAENSFSTNGAWLANDRLALLGSPDATQLLVGWVGASPDQGSSLFLRRFDCVPPG